MSIRLDTSDFELHKQFMDTMDFIMNRLMDYQFQDRRLTLRKVSSYRGGSDFQNTNKGPWKADYVARKWRKWNYWDAQNHRRDSRAVVYVWTGLHNSL